MLTQTLHTTCGKLTGDKWAFNSLLSAYILESTNDNFKDIFLFWHGQVGNFPWFLIYEESPLLVKSHQANSRINDDMHAGNELNLHQLSYKYWLLIDYTGIYFMLSRSERTHIFKTLFYYVRKISAIFFPMGPHWTLLNFVTTRRVCRKIMSPAEGSVKITLQILRGYEIFRHSWAYLITWSPEIRSIF